jgi:hypothetical protein
MYLSVDNGRLQQPENVMNVKELEAVIEALKAQINGDREQMVARIGAVEKSVEALEFFANKELSAMRGVHSALEGLHDALSNSFDAHRASFEGLVEKVEGRNKSAPVHRNMTDADAMRVLAGTEKDLPHKEAGEVLGLTYAQVYSCRLGYTFKHVFRELEKTGWKSQWEKGA